VWGWSPDWSSHLSTESIALSQLWPVLTQTCIFSLWLCQHVLVPSSVNARATRPVTYSCHDFSTMNAFTYLLMWRFLIWYILSQAGVSLSKPLSKHLPQVVRTPVLSDHQVMTIFGPIHDCDTAITFFWTKSSNQHLFLSQSRWVSTIFWGYIYIEMALLWCCQESSGWVSWWGWVHSDGVIVLECLVVQFFYELVHTCISDVQICSAHAGAIVSDCLLSIVNHTPWCTPDWLIGLDCWG
jgi:hypothetical protein